MSFFWNALLTSSVCVIFLHEQHWSCMNQLQEVNGWISFSEQSQIHCSSHYNHPVIVECSKQMLWAPTFFHPQTPTVGTLKKCSRIPPRRGITIDLSPSMVWEGELEMHFLCLKWHFQPCPDICQ